MLVLVGVVALVLGMFIGVGVTAVAATFAFDHGRFARHGQVRPAPAQPYGPYGKPDPGQRGGYRWPAPPAPRKMPAKPQPSPTSS